MEMVVDTVGVVTVGEIGAGLQVALEVETDMDVAVTAVAVMAVVDVVDTVEVTPMSLEDVVDTAVAVDTLDAVAVDMIVEAVLPDAPSHHHDVVLSHVDLLPMSVEVAQLEVRYLDLARHLVPARVLHVVVLEATRAPVTLQEATVAEVVAYLGVQNERNLHLRGGQLLQGGRYLQSEQNQMQTIRTLALSDGKKGGRDQIIVSKGFFLQYR